MSQDKKQRIEKEIKYVIIVKGGKSFYKCKRCGFEADTKKKFGHHFISTLHVNSKFKEYAF